MDQAQKCTHISGEFWNESGSFDSFYSTVFNYYIDLLCIHFLLPTFLNSVMKCCYIIFWGENYLYDREIL